MSNAKVLRVDDRQTVDGVGVAVCFTEVSFEGQGAEDGFAWLEGSSPAD